MFRPRRHAEYAGDRDQSQRHCGSPMSHRMLRPLGNLVISPASARACIIAINKTRGNVDPRLGGRLAKNGPRGATGPGGRDQADGPKRGGRCQGHGRTLCRKAAEWISVHGSRTENTFNKRAASLLRSVEISQIRRRLILVCRHTVDLPSSGNSSVCRSRPAQCSHRNNIRASSSSVSARPAASSAGAASFQERQSLHTASEAVLMC
jgi:hypothetical protein